MSGARRVAGAVVVALVGLTGCAPTRPAATAPAAPAAPSAVAAPVLELTGTVDALDREARRMTVRGAQGAPVALAVADAVPLRRVRVGNRVQVRYRPSVAALVRKPGDAVAGGAPTRAVTVTTKLSQVDRTAGTITVTGAEGMPVTVVVPDRRQLDRLAAGDLVEVAYTEAVAIAVAPAQRK